MRAEALLLDGTLQELQGGVAAVLLDDEHPDAGLVAGLDHAQAIVPARGHRLFGHDDDGRIARLQSACPGCKPLGVVSTTISAVVVLSISVMLKCPLAPVR